MLRDDFLGDLGLLGPGLKPSFNESSRKHCRWRVEANTLFEDFFDLGGGGSGRGSGEVDGVRELWSDSWLL